MNVADLRVVFSGDSKGAEQAADRTTGAMGRVSSLGSKALKGVAIAGVAAFAAVGTAAAATAVSSVQDFASFEGGMNEVFTLLPGISGDAMDAMSDQVKDLSNEFGVLPDEVVPALYQSLSAGVPKDNVFDFLETAQMAAKGGVTELETAVNGITGVVNAYGADVIDAATASDLMFTTVKLGKTTFDEMSASLGDVTPIAAAMGVSFEEVSAALAASTAITGNTSKSVTGLKGLIGELGKEGQVAAKSFEEIAGKSFPEFIAGGGDLAGALDIMKDSAEKGGGSILDLFGSIEAGQAALQLTGSDTFVNNVVAMGDAAGATEAAYDQMDQGIDAALEKLKANWATAKLDIGEGFAPIVTKAAEDMLPALQPLLEQLVGVFAEVAESLTPVMENVGGFVEKLQPLFDLIVELLPVVLELATMVGSFLLDAFSTIAPLISDVAEIVVDALGAALEAVLPIIEDLLPIFAGVAATLADLLMPVVEALAPVLEELAPIAVLLAEAFADTLAQVLVELMPALVQLLPPLTQLVLLMVSDFLPIILELLPMIVGLATGIAAFAEVLGGAVQFIVDNWDLLGPLFGGVATVIATLLIPHFVMLGIAAVTNAATVVAGWITTQVGAASAALSQGIAVTTMVAGWVLMGIQSMLGAAKMAAAWLIAMGPIGLAIAAVVALVAIIVKNWDTIVAATKVAFSWVSDKVKQVFDFLKTLFLNFTPVGQLIKNWDKIKDAATAVFGWVSDKFGSMVDFVTSLPSKMANAARGLFDGIKDAFKSALNWIIGKWNSLEFKVPGFDPPGPGPKFNGFTMGVPDIPRFATGAVLTEPTLNISGEYPGAKSNPEIVTPQDIMRDTFRDELRRSNGMGASTGPSVTIELNGDIYGMDDFRSKVRAAAQEAVDATVDELVTSVEVR